MRSRNRFLLPVLAISVTATVVIYGLPWLQRPGIDHLVNQALSAASPAVQVDAAQQLCQLGGRAIPGMRRLITESDNQDVVAISILGASREMDYQSMDQILHRLDDPSATIRSAAATASTQMLGRDHHFPVHGSPEHRIRVKNQMVADWQAYNGSELFEFNKNRLEN